MRLYKFNGVTYSHPLSGGKPGHCPTILARIFTTDQKRGRGFDPPPNIWSPNGNLSPTCRKKPQNTAKRRKTPQYTAKRSKTPQNATKRRKTPQKAAKHRNTPQHAANLLAVAANSPQNAAKCPKTRQNAAKCCKTPQDIVNWR